MFWSSAWIVSLVLCDMGCGGREGSERRHIWTQIQRKRKRDREREALGKFKRDGLGLYNNSTQLVDGFM